MVPSSSSAGLISFRIRSRCGGSMHRHPPASNQPPGKCLVSSEPRSSLLVGFQGAARPLQATISCQESTANAEANGEICQRFRGEGRCALCLTGSILKSQRRPPPSSNSLVSALVQRVPLLGTWTRLRQIVVKVPTFPSIASLHSRSSCRIALLRRPRQAWGAVAESP